MEVRPRIKILKYILCILTTIYMLFIVLFFTSAISVPTETEASIVVALASTEFLVPIMGLFGIYREHPGLLNSYAAAQLWTAIQFFVMGSIQAEFIPPKPDLDYFQITQERYYLAASNIEFWDDLHEKYICCGTYGIGDWGKKAPISCCHNYPLYGKKDDNCPVDKPYTSDVGCYDRALSERYFKILYTILFFIMAIVVGASSIVSIMLIILIKHEMQIRLKEEEMIRMKSNYVSKKV